ncbi:MAG: formylglycine-generating enzyme family protein [Planctomycetes bacterium]|nr:formylglycine-generating enzyme family protein [Planctomycetota bacterium]
MNCQQLAVLTLVVTLVVPRLVRAEQPEIGTNPTITNSIEMKLARIPAGTFVMGSRRSEAERDNKEERHEVSITKPFYIGVCEVKQSEYVEVMRGIENFNNRSAFQGDDLPVETVEWKMAKIFCERLTDRSEEKAAGRKYRLPTEAEWEYACRAGTSTAFHFGDSLSSEQANFNGRYPAGDGKQGKYLRRTSVVGSYKPNSFGLYDMHGNVAEWCSDWYDPEYYADSPEEDPLGPPFGVVDTKFTNNGNQNFFVVIRGGCWVDDGRACRSAYRFRAMPNTQYRLIGFRVVCTVEGE